MTHVRRSLAPGRAEARPIDALVAELPAGEAADGVRAVLEAVERAVAEHFPENLYCDLDALAASLHEDARETLDLGQWQAKTTQTLCDLHARFGRGGPIRFRYVHDFLYGFDWARWVRKDPVARRGVGPFDAVFCQRMLRRGEELEQLIEADDRKYPRLGQGGHRNPFGFARDPEAEARLLRALAGRDLIPVRAWESAPRLDAARDYAAARDEVARELGIAGAPADAASG